MKSSAVIMFCFNYVGLVIGRISSHEAPLWLWLVIISAGIMDQSGRVWALFLAEGNPLLSDLLPASVTLEKMIPKSRENASRAWWKLPELGVTMLVCMRGRGQAPTEKWAC